MLETLVNRLPKGRDRGIALTVGGMAALLAGSKGLAATMFAGGLSDLEQAWRAAHPGFHGDLKARWAEAVSFYEATHRDPTNRVLHVAGIPLILGGAVGAPSRWYLDQFVQARHRSRFPWGTYLINMIGSFVLGVLLGATAAAARRAFGERGRSLWLALVVLPWALAAAATRGGAGDLASLPGWLAWAWHALTGGA